MDVLLTEATLSRVLVGTLVITVVRTLAIGFKGRLPGWKLGSS